MAVANAKVVHDTDGLPRVDVDVFEPGALESRNGFFAAHALDLRAALCGVANVEFFVAEWTHVSDEPVCLAPLKRQNRVSSEFHLHFVVSLVRLKEYEFTYL